MEKSANTIGRGKYLKLSEPGRHKLLADLAGEALASGDYDGFGARYRQIHDWGSLDRYDPPGWLTPREAAQSRRLFHLGFCVNYKEPEGEPAPTPPWRPRFSVELALDRPRSPYNLGAALRLTDNFGFAGLTHNAPWIRWDHPQLRKAARGCERWIPKRRVEDMLACLHEVDAPVVGVELDPRATPLPDWQPPAACVLLAGNEQYGLAQALRDRCDQLVYVPMWGFKASMNLSCALATVAQKIVARHGASLLKFRSQP